MDILSQWQGLSEEARLRLCLGLMLSFGLDAETIPVAGDLRAWDELIAAGMVRVAGNDARALRLTPEGGRAILAVMHQEIFAQPVGA
jgi:hypothetical protein